MIHRAVLGGALLLERGAIHDAGSVAAHLRAPNPAFESWRKRSQRGERAGPRPPEFVTCSGEIPEGSGTGWDHGAWLPRFAPAKVGHLIDRRVAPQAPPVELDLTLHPYQARAVEAWERAGGEGLIVAPCGAGKTVMGEAVIASKGTPALVLVHTTDLVEQWVERIGSQLRGATVGVVGEGRREDDARVVVATLQTLASWPWWERLEWGKRFGLVIIDECHHAPADTFAEVLSTLPGRYRLGLTATPERHDGLTDWVRWCCGPEVYRIEQRDLEAAGKVLSPSIRWVHTGWEPPAFDNWSELISLLCDDEDRNRLIVELVRERLDGGRVALVLSDRVDHCRELAAQVNAACGDGTAAALVGRVSKKRRKEILAEAQTGALRCITATSVADEGLDVPRLDTVVLACPSKNLGRVQQRVGRACRAHDDKQPPEVLDLVDAWGPFQGFAWKRFRLYRDLGWSPAPPTGGRR